MGITRRTGGSRVRHAWFTAVLLLLAPSLLVSGVACGGQSAGNNDLLKLVPEDAEGLLIADMNRLREDRDLGEAGNLPPPSEEIDLEEVDTYLIVQLEPTRRVYLLKGRFFFDDLRDDLEDLGYEEDSYRDYEIWSGFKTYAMLEEDGLIVVSDEETAVEQSLRVLHRDSGSLADAENNDLKRILERLGDAPSVAGAAGGQCRVKRCLAWGQAITRYDIDEEAMIAEVALLFSSERAAERAAENHDEVKDFVEGRNTYDMNLADTTSDGEFVLATATMSALAGPAPAPRTPSSTRPIIVTVAPPSGLSREVMENFSTLDLARILVDCNLDQGDADMRKLVSHHGSKENVAWLIEERFSRDRIIDDLLKFKC